MPALTFTANSATDQLTIPSHGLLTGDGPATLYTESGVLPTGSPAIPALTDVFIIRIDDNTVRLATSNTNALSGTFVDILTNGSGTLKLLIGAPYRRPRTYAPGVQLSSGDLNTNFDSWVDVWNLLTGQAQSTYSVVKLSGGLTLSSVVAPSQTVPLKVGTSGSVSAGYDTVTFNCAHAQITIGSPAVFADIGGFGGLALLTSTSLNYLPMTLPVGFRIASWQLQCQKNSGSGTLTAELWDINGLTGIGAKIGATQTNSASSPGNIQLGQSGLSTVVTAGHSYQATLRGGGTTGDFLVSYSVTPG